MLARVPTGQLQSWAEPRRSPCPSLDATSCPGSCDTRREARAKDASLGVGNKPRGEGSARRLQDGPGPAQAGGRREQDWGSIPAEGSGVGRAHGTGTPSYERQAGWDPVRWQSPGRTPRPLGARRRQGGARPGPATGLTHRVWRPGHLPGASGDGGPAPPHPHQRPGLACQAGRQEQRSGPRHTATAGWPHLIF